MCLRDGAVDGQQIVPASFFDDIRSNASTELGSFQQRFLPDGTGYRSFFYHFEEHGNAIAAGGAYGQVCYMNPSYSTVIVWYSTFPSMPGDIDDLDEEAFQHVCTPYLEQWHACHEISKVFG